MPALFMPYYMRPCMLSKKHQRSSTVQEVGLTNDHCCYCISKRMTSLNHAYINRARLTVCEVGVFLKEIFVQKKKKKLFVNF